MRASVLREPHRYDDAARQFVAALTHFEACDGSRFAVACHEALASIAQRAGDLSLAEQHLWPTLRCLLDTADRFCPRDGVVRVSYRCDDDTAVIGVADEGPGLPDGFAEAAFEPFRQADLTERRDHGGLDMGLCTARRLARRLRGDVVLRPGARCGALAEIRLPAHQVTLGAPTVTDVR